MNPARLFSVRHLKKSDFVFESSVQTLRSLHVDDFADAVGADPSATYELDKRSQTLMFKSFIDFRKTNMVRQRTRAGLNSHRATCSAKLELRADCALSSFLVSGLCDGRSGSIDHDEWSLLGF